MYRRPEAEMLLALLMLLATVSDALVTSPVVVNAFVRLSFQPQPLTLHRGGHGAVRVTAIVDRNHGGATHLPMELRMHAVDPSTATVSAPRGRTLLASTETRFNVTAVGRELGRTSVTFFLSGNTSSGGTENASVVILQAWRLPPRYNLNLVVRNPPNHAEVYLNAMALIMVGVNLVGIGGQVDSVEVVYLVRRPLSLAVGLFCRFGIMPALALGLVEMLHSTSNMTFGVLSLTCSPSEGVNNLLLLLADGDLTLSATISSVNNFATLAMIPVWTILFETRLFSVAGNIVIPFREIFFVFAASLALLLSGYVLQRRYSDLYDVCWMYLPIFTVCTVVFSVIASLFVNGFIFRYITVRIFLLSALLAAAGYGVGAASAFAVGLPQSRILTIAVETGGRTTVITNLLLVSSMAQPEADLAKTAPVLCSLLSVVPAFVAILVRRFMLRLRERKYAQTECTFIDSRDDVSEEEVVAAKETCM